MILAHTNADVQELNRLARGRMRVGKLGAEVTLEGERGERAKDTTLDYTRASAERRGIGVPLEVQRETEKACQVAHEKTPCRKRSMFEGLKLEPALEPALGSPPLDPHAEQPAQLRRSVAGQAADASQTAEEARKA